MYNRQQSDSRAPESSRDIELREIGLRSRNSEPPPVPAPRPRNHSNGPAHANVNDGSRVHAADDAANSDHYSTIDENWSSSYDSETTPKMYDNDRYRSATEMSVQP